MQNNNPRTQGNPAPRPYVPQASQGQRPANPAPRPYQGGGGYQGNRPWQRRDDRRSEPQGRHRLNHMIRVPQVRVVQDGKQLGVMSTSEALSLAIEAGLDLVEIAPQGQPPVCSIMDYGKFKYDEKIKEKNQQKKQREAANQEKEIRLSPAIGDHDIEVKAKHAREFLDDGKKVRVTIFFMRRQLAHKELGFEVAKQFIAALGENITVEAQPKLEGNRINFRVASKQA